MPTSHRRAPAVQPASARLVSLDVIRVAVIVMVIVHHAAQPYGPTGGEWPVTDAAQSDWFRPFYTVNAAVGLGLLFLLAGYLAPQSCDRKGPRRFLRERWSRLGVPLVVFALAANLPIALAGERPDSIHGFVSSLYRDAWAPLYLHLWFVGHLLLYSAAYVTWRRFAGRAPRSWPAPGHRSIVFFTVGLIVVTWVVRWWYSVDEWVPLLWLVPAEPAHLPQYVSLFVLGVMAYRSDWLHGLPSGVGKLWLGVGLVATVCVVAVQMLAPDGWRYNELADGGVGWQSMVRSTLEGLICVGLAVGVPVVVRELVHRPLRLVSATAVISYAAYILHVYIVVPIQVAVTGPDLSPFLKFGVVAVLAILFSFGAAHLSRRVPGLRRLLGTTPPLAPGGKAWRDPKLRDPRPGSEAGPEADTGH
jgi:surface polysaccharide O-acyltransferase-like enzyme